MANINREDIEKLARLARLRLTKDEVIKFQSEISEILEYVEMLEKVDVSGLKPTYQVTGLVNVTRTDELRDYGSSHDDLMKNVPQKNGKYIQVKRMIG